MPFEVFRRHQRSCSRSSRSWPCSASWSPTACPGCSAPATPGRDQPVVNALRQDDLSAATSTRWQAQRSTGQPVRVAADPYFGPSPVRRHSKTRDLVDALILQHEADRLGMPAGPEVGTRVAQAGHRRQDDRASSSRRCWAGFNNRVSGDQLLADIANQVRLSQRPATPRLSSPMVTPYDVFQAYRDQNERVAAKLVEVPVEQVPRPGPRAVRGGDPGVLRQVQGCPARPVAADARASRSPARFRSRSSRSTAMPWPAASRTSSPRPSCAPPTRTASRSSRSSRSGRPAQRPLRRPARADPAGHPAVRGRPRRAGLARWPRRRHRPRSSTSSRRSRRTS